MATKSSNISLNLPGADLHQNSNPSSGDVSNGQRQESNSLETFCKACESMFSTLDGLQALVSEQGYEWLNYEEISDATRGCSLCKLLKAEGFAYPPEKRTHLRAEKGEIGSNETKKMVPGYPSEILSATYLRRVHRMGGGSKDDRVFTISKIPDDESASWLSCSSLSYDLAGVEAMGACLSMLKQCQEDHKSCESQIIPPLPTRVIDLGDPKNPRLFITEPNQRACYVALSYSWGGPQEVRLTKDTIETKVKGLPLENLPQTLQDAAEITWKLGIRYLWIDALCIIQDDSSDIISEIESMGNIYRSSTITIAASDSKSVRDGFLKSKSQYSTCKLPFYLPDNRMGNIQVSYYKKMADQSSWYLNTRAWSLQEELLSPRLLFFAGGEIRWQCQTIYKERILGSSSINFEEWQCLQRLPPAVFRSTAEARTVDDAIQSLEGEAAVDELRQEQSNIWRDIIKNYSKRGITEPLDRLPALAGIIRSLEKIWLDKCVAGLWNNCFLEHLLWQKVYGNTVGCTGPIYKGCDCKSVAKTRPDIVAPTWSWISCGKAVQLGEIHVLKSELISCSVQFLDKKAPMAAVKSGLCVIRASVVKGPLQYNLGPKLRSEFNHVRVDSIDPCGFTCNEIFERAIYARIGTYNVSPRVDPNDPRNRFVAKGLVLMEVDDGLFERVGVFTELKNVFDDPELSELKTLKIM